MAEGWGFPGEGDAAGGDGEGGGGGAWAEGGWIEWDEGLGAAAWEEAFGEGGEGGGGFFRLEIARDDGEAAVGGVAGLVVCGEVRVADEVEEVAVADDGVAAGVEGEGGGEEELGGGVVGVVEAHVDFAADDVFFLFEFGFGEGGVEDEAGEAFQEGVEGVGGAVDVVDGAIEGGVGVPVATGGLDGVCEGFSVEIAGAFEDHVFEEVGDACAEVVAFVGAAGGDPDLGGDDGSGGVWIEDEGEAVREGGDGGEGGGVFHGNSAWMGGECRIKERHATMDRAGSVGAWAFGGGVAVWLPGVFEEQACADVGTDADQCGIDVREADRDLR